MSSLKIFSFNCRGLKSSSKRIDMFSMFIEKQADIICLQETHLLEENEKQVYSEWKGECMNNHWKIISKRGYNFIQYKARCKFFKS